MSFQQVIIQGNLGQDPEVRSLRSGDTVVNLSVAVNESWTDKKSGEKQEHTEWFRCTAFGKVAELIEEYHRQGSLIMLVGKMRTRKYTDKHDNERQATDLIVDRLVFQPNAEQSETSRDVRTQARDEKPRQDERSRRGNDGRTTNRDPDIRGRKERQLDKDRQRAQANDDDSRAGDGEDFDDDLPF